MLFNSYVFIFVFLPIVCAGYFVALRFGKSNISAWLAIASLLFYAWWDVRFLPLLLGSIAINYWIALQIKRALVRNANHASRWLVVGIVFNLSLLGFFKYTNFLLDNVGALTGQTIDFYRVILPIGISFFTFQQIAYLVDVKRGFDDRYSLIDYTLFVSFFPQLIAGPIVHHKEMMPQLQNPNSNFAENLSIGGSLFIAGLFKKILIADNLAAFATPVFQAADSGLAVSSAEAWGASLAYSLQIYFDFSGYSDMALGLARMFGVRLPFNFFSPYKSTSIIDFWRTWHMTLSQFLRDYLYIALGGNRFGVLRRYSNLMVTMLLGGLWHGAGWGFVIWGALHGIYLVVNHGFRNLMGTTEHQNVAMRPMLKAAALLLTTLCVTVAWVFFRAETLPGALQLLSSMFNLPGSAEWIQAEQVLPQKDWSRLGWPLIGVGFLIAWLLPNTNEFFFGGDRPYQAKYPNLNLQKPSKLQWMPNPAVALVFLAAFVTILLIPSSASEFLYFQF